MDGWKMVLIIGYLLNAGVQQGSTIDLCAKPRINDLQWHGRQTFNARRCGWGDKSLLLLIDVRDNCYSYTFEIQDQRVYLSPGKTCVVISKGYNNSANPTSYFSNCQRVLWIPLRTKNQNTLTIYPPGCGLSLEYEFTNTKALDGTGKHSGSRGSTNDTVISLAILFTIVLIGLLVLLAIMFKEKLITLVNKTKMRAMKDSDKEASPTCPTSNGVYAEAVDPSIYHEVEPRNEQVVIQNQLYGMN